MLYMCKHLKLFPYCALFVLLVLSYPECFLIVSTVLLYIIFYSFNDYQRLQHVFDL